MRQIVSITSQGQLTIPKSIRRALGILRQTKALIQRKDNVIIVEPKPDFWTLSGSLKSSVSLPDSELKKTRKAFTKQWPRI